MSPINIPKDVIRSQMGKSVTQGVTQLLPGMADQFQWVFQSVVPKDLNMRVACDVAAFFYTCRRCTAEGSKHPVG
jgi:hypothetical protein